jgi:hypothetical protein|tara:strand:+ start:12626 stop:12838 length:213 start_codon:yes stop_codon:yes gene_type:complete
MSKIERADRTAGGENPQVTLNGRTIDLGDSEYDVRSFAKALRKRKRKPKTMAEREAWQREVGAKLDRHGY